ncbi:MAG: phosphoenolpyruvate--protein phosphotransferase [Desulfobacterium sp.]
MKKKDHLELLCDAGEMFALLSGVSDTKKILQRCVRLVAKHLKAEVCSIYLLHTPEQELVLRATTGLNPDSVDVVKMKVGEGLVGKSMETMEIILEDQASLNPDFKYFPATREKKFECFLAIPILRGTQGIGVMVVQRQANHPFSGDEAMVLRSIASQLAMLIENARILLGFKGNEMPEKTHLSSRKPQKKMALPRIIQARVASRGMAMGKAMLARHNPILDMLRSNEEVSDDPSRGIVELENAITQTINQIETLEQEISQRIPEAVSLIFDAHIMILKDKGFSVKMKALTRQGQPALSAVVIVARKYIHLFGSSPDEYLQEKAADVEDIAVRLIENLMQTTTEGTSNHENKILIARDLLPSEAVKFAMKGVAGIILTGGGITSHAAILARSLGLPMLITKKLDLLSITGSPTIIMDAQMGNIYFDPDQEIRTKFHTSMDSPPLPNEIPQKETHTADGVPISLMVNINLLGELDSAVRLNARGVGLYRSEFPFLVRSNFPSDAEQKRVYDILLSKMAGKEVTIRTLDVGGDKMLAYFDNAGEANPELGLRSIRFTFKYPEIMSQQIKAILTAATEADPATELRIMFPMVSSLDEFQRAKQMVIDCYEELKISGKEDKGVGIENSGLTKLPKIGMMLELPSVVEIIDDLAAEADFFSIGTNDFVQYMLAADRTNDRVTEYYTPHHPSVLRALNRIARAVIAAGKDISVCGEMAKEKAFIPFFMGIGIRKLSVNQHFLFTVQNCIRQWNIPDAEAYAASLLSQNSVKGIFGMLAQ